MRDEEYRGVELGDPGFGCLDEEYFCFWWSCGFYTYAKTILDCAICTGSEGFILVHHSHPGKWQLATRIHKLWSYVLPKTTMKSAKSTKKRWNNGNHARTSYKHGKALLKT